jgi:hypothetical protein
MLTHIVCWKYKDGTPEDIRSQHRSELQALKSVIPEVLDLRVGEDVLHLERSYDTGLVAIFSSLDTLDAYNVHPKHQTVAAMGREISAHVVSVDFLADEEIISE